MHDITDDVEIVKVDLASADAVSAFLDLARAYLSEQNSMSTAVHDHFLQSILLRQDEPDRWLLLLKSAGEYVAFVHAKIDRDERPGWGYVLEFYVIPDKRKAGWGEKLFDHLVGILKSNGVRHVWLTANPPAEPFWEALGFKPTGETQHDLKVMTADI